jgi:hypothetical protein
VRISVPHLTTAPHVAALQHRKKEDVNILLQILHPASITTCLTRINAHDRGMKMDALILCSHAPVSYRLCTSFKGQMSAAQGVLLSLAAHVISVCSVLPL